jgi:hypothetical protein
MDLFERGVQEFGIIPYRVRGDRGGENRLVAEFMLQHRGLGRNSYQTGSSRFNTR